MVSKIDFLYFCYIFSNNMVAQNCEEPVVLLIKRREGSHYHQFYIHNWEDLVHCFQEKERDSICSTTNMLSLCCLMLSGVGRKRSISNCRCFSWYTPKQSSLNVSTSFFLILLIKSSAAAILCSLSSHLPI